ncbi:MAG: hypothetical protein ABMB14_01925 [Myxococcota bacterium]
MLIALLATARADVPTESYEHQTWAVVVELVDEACFLVDPVNAFDPDPGDPKVVVWPDDPIDTVDPKEAASIDPKKRSDAADSPFVDCREAHTVVIAPVYCENQCRCTDTCGKDGGWTCDGPIPEAVEAWDPSTATLIDTTAQQCSPPDPKDPDPTGGHPA